MSQTHLRIQKWKELLLDLGKRNQLVSFKEKKSSSLRFIYHDASSFIENLFEHKKLEVASLFSKNNQSILEDYLSDETESTSKTIEVFGVPIKEKDLYSETELMPVIEGFLKSQKKSDSSKWLFTNRFRSQQNKVLMSLKKTAKSHIEETSVNVLYFAVSFLEYYESESSSTPIYAPLFLIPAGIEQASLNTPFFMTVVDEDLMLNETLIKKMEIEYGLNFKFKKDTEQEDESFIKQYYAHIQKQFTDPRWTINNEVHLGIFKFSTIHMVNDIEENIDLIAENDLISRLSGNLEHMDSIDQSMDDVDVSTIQPSDVYAVLDADSSQMRAVEAAKAGKSFVLQGPPGTGKSQTITNIIAELIAQNKRVLFVSEKRAALDVVLSNLSKVDLHGYALALHGAKANKKEILEELRVALARSQRSEQISDRSMSETYQNYSFHKSKLDEYATKLMEPRTALEMSMYEVYGKYFKYQTATTLSFEINNIDKVSSESLYQMVSNVASYGSLSKRLTIPLPVSLWRHLNIVKLSLSIKQQFENKFRALLPVCEYLAEGINSLDSLSSDIVGLSYLESLVRFMELSQSSHDLTWALLNEKLDPQDRERYSKLEILNKTIQSLQQDVMANYKPNFITSPSLSKYLELLNNEFRSPIKRLVSPSYREFKKQIQSYMIIPSAYKYSTALEQIKHAIEWNQASKERTKTEASLSAAIDAYKQENTSWSHLYDLLDVLFEMNDLMSTLSNEGLIKETIELIYHESKDLSTQRLEHLRSLIDQFLPEEAVLQELFDAKSSIFEGLTLQDVINSLNQIDQLISDLDDAHNLIQLQRTMRNQFLEGFLKSMESEEIPIDLEDAFFKRFYQLWVDHVRYTEPVFAGFNQEEYARTKQEFMANDKRLIQIGKAKIDRRFYENSININGMDSQRYDVRLLTKEISKKRKVMPLRRLFEEIPELIMSLKPVFMMSPLSVSLFLESDKFTFDTIIFDEASQIKTESAVVALYRGKQHIIVGDREQLPPTNFFNKAGDDDDTDYEDDTNAFDSILEESSVALKSIPLTWHYRSRYEQLIHFSNATIYKNLISFPTPKQKSKYNGVDFEYVENAIYYRGNTGGQGNTNPLEATRVVELIFDHFKQFGKTRTLGVVTLGTSQMKEVEKQLYIQRKKDPSLDEYFSDELAEPFFIKNIETVQGDERDTIILSIGFGKDQNGRLMMNFGPINQDAGYRRLNVAITRAKHNVILVSSIMDSDIDLSRSEARGVKLLKQYIEYARNGNELVMEEPADRPGWFDSPFEEDVHDFLVSQGYKVQSQVGVAGFRIDLGVVHPSNDQEYLLGIECDGATFHSSKVARDRDRLRQEILETRGWIIYRIWSTEWFYRRTQERDRLMAFIDGILNKKPTPKIVDKPQAKVELEKVELKKEFDVVYIPDSEVAKEFLKNRLLSTVEETIKESVARALSKYVENDHAVYPNLTELYNRVLSQISTTFYRDRQKSMVQLLALALSPVATSVFYPLVAPLYGYKVVNSNLKQTIRADLQSISPRGAYKVSDFIIVDGQDVWYRPNITFSTERKIDHVHDLEIQVFITTILQQLQRVEKDVCYRLFSEYIGQNRVSSVMKDRVDRCLQNLEIANQLQVANGLIELLQNH